MPSIRVLLVDDHPVVRAGIRRVLESDKQILVVGEAGDGAEALRMAEALFPDVVVLDVELPGLSGVDVAHQLRQAASNTRILVLSAHNDLSYIQGLLSTGVYGYLMKEEAPEKIVEAVRGVARGEQGWLSRQITSRMACWMGMEPPKANGLTSREGQVLQAVVAGKTNQEIGLALGVSEKAVEKHLLGIFNKLGVNSRLEAAVMAVRQGWL